MKAEKAAFRREMLLKRAALDAESRAQADRRISNNITGLPAFDRARTIFCYVSVGDEPDTRALMEAARAQGKRVCVPLCTAMGVMEARAISGEGDLQSGKYDIPEPRPACPVVPPGDIDLIVTPCVCCDREGYRLGYGGGFYDRWLAESRAPAVVLCYEAMMVEAVPREAHDQKADLVVTEAGVYRFKDGL